MPAAGAGGRRRRCRRWPSTRRPARARWRPAAWSCARWPLALHLLDRRARLNELEAARAEVLHHDAPRQQLPGQGPGRGPPWTTTIRAEGGAGERFSRGDQVSADAGWEPRVHASGRYAGPRHRSKHGPGARRHAVSRATLVAVRCRPAWRAGYPRRLDRGRAKQEALAIRARTLLTVLSHLLRTGASYDPTRINLVGPGQPG